MTVNFFGLTLNSLNAIRINVASISAVSIVMITIVFAFLMRTPTLQGRKVMDEIDGPKLYLETAEKDHMNMVDKLLMRVSRFERLLPFAIALEVEKPWSEHFEVELARNAVADAPDHYAPSWYNGDIGSVGWSASNMSNVVSAAAASMTAAMIAAQPVQASSSGFSSSGGGGSSSGGGGSGG